MDTQALHVSDNLSTIGVEKDDILLFHLPSNVDDKYFKDFKKLFIKKNGDKILPCEAVFMPDCIKMTVIKPLKKG